MGAVPFSLRIDADLKEQLEVEARLELCLFMITAQVNYLMLRAAHHKS